MLELFSGCGSVAAAFRAAGWETLTVDIDSGCRPDVVARVEEFEYAGPRLDVVWASPPCTTFSLAHYLRGVEPSGADWPLVQLTRRKIIALRPQYWILENVVGLARWWPDYAQRVGPWYLWGHFPPIPTTGIGGKCCASGWGLRAQRRRRALAGLQGADPSVRSPRRRAAIPAVLAAAVVRGISQQLALPL